MKLTAYDCQHLSRMRFDWLRKAQAYAKEGNKSAAERYAAMWRGMSMQRALRLASASAYLAPWDVQRVVERIGPRYSGSNATLTKLRRESWFYSAEWVGLAKGHPPILAGEPGFSSLIDTLRRLRPDAGARKRKKDGPLGADVAVLTAMLHKRKGVI